MSYNYVIDSSAWLGYLMGTEKGIKIKTLIEQEEIATSIIALAEIADKLARDNIRFHIMLQFIQRRAAIIPLSIELALKAAQLKKEARKKKENFSMADGVHLATALQEGAVLVTSDSDFAGMEGAMVV